MAGKKKAIIFARVSTKRQEKEGLSLKEIQLPILQKYTKDNDFEVVEVFALSETGGDRKERAKFDRMVELLKKRKDITEIVSFRVDRITRNFRDAVVMDEMRIAHDKYIHCVDDRLVLHRESPARDLTQWNVKVFVAQEYINRVIEDGNNTKLNKLERGELPWAAPFGYKHHKFEDKRKTIVSVQPNAQIVREIHVRYSTGSYSCQSLAQEISNEFSMKLTKGQIQRVLRDRFYIGIMTDKKTGKEYPHFYEKLVSDDMFERNQDILNGHSGRRQRYAGLPSIYRGLIRCKFCGCTITPEKKQKKQKNGNVHNYYYYHCTNGKKMHTAPIQYATEKDLNDAMSQILKDFRISEEKLAEVRQALNESHADKNSFYEAKRKELVARRKQLSNRKQNMYDMLADKCITPQEYNENNARYDDEIADVRRQEQRLDEADKQFYVTAGYLLAIFQYAEKIFEAAEIEEKRQIIGLLLSNLQLDGKRLYFTLKEPFANVLSHANGSLWLGMRDSNPRSRDQNPVPYHLANPQYG